MNGVVQEWIMVIGISKKRRRERLNHGALGRIRSCTRVTVCDLRVTIPAYHPNVLHRYFLVYTSQVSPID